jgi:hypothetical protein
MELPPRNATETLSALQEFRSIVILEMKCAKQI